ncbi:MAG: FmdB family zinc ribbon protein [Desulfatiglandales bacterium]
MPIYEFKCNKCGKSFEHLVLGSDREQGPSCPVCGHGDTSRLMSSFSCGSADSKGGIGSISSSCSSPSGGFS